jgi:hypothetical protein
MMPVVMPALVAGIHVWLALGCKDLDGWASQSKRGHDAW